MTPVRVGDGRNALNIGVPEPPPALATPLDVHRVVAKRFEIKTGLLDAYAVTA